MLEIPAVIKTAEELKNAFETLLFIKKLILELSDHGVLDEINIVNGSIKLEWTGLVIPRVYACFSWNKERDILQVLKDKENELNKLMSNMSLSSQIISKHCNI